MHFFRFVALASTLVSSAYGFCGADPGSKEQIDAFEKQFQSIVQGNDTLAKGLNLGKRGLDKRAPFTVPVYWNVLYDSSNNEGNFPDSVITQTMNVVNSNFNQIRLSFAVAGVRRIPVSAQFLHGFATGNANDRQIKSQNNVRNVQALNIYTVGNNPNFPYAGWATFPKDYNQDPAIDGIIYDFNYLPGGRAGPAYNTGKIMSHEIGHWVGLYHTFQDGCNGGDFVDDTPAEASAASGCPRGRDSCPAPGADPIENMMDYSDDTCRRGFTNGQFNRIAQQLYQFRGINLY